MNKLKELLDRIKKIKNIEIILAITAVVVMLLIYFSSTGVISEKKEKTTSQVKMDYCDKVQQDILRTVKSIRGAGKTEVAIHWSGSIEYVYAENVNSTDKSYSSSLQIPSSTKEPILLKTIYPNAVGVVIVCEGGGNAKVKVNVILAVSTLLEISTDKILVIEMNKK